jgi:peptidoglycan-associated lipoprotein
MTLRLSINRFRRGAAPTALVVCAGVLACAGQPRPVTAPSELLSGLRTPERPTTSSSQTYVVASLPADSARVRHHINTRPIDQLNPEPPLPTLFFAFDSASLDFEGRKMLEAAAETLRAHSAWVVAVEAFCDERGASEYNLALGERRAAAVELYLVSLGIPSRQLRTVSYGEQIPFDPAHAEAAWAKNRRVELVLISR